MLKYYLGIDPSLTGFSFVLLNENGELVCAHTLQTSPKNFSCFSHRLHETLKFFEEKISRYTNSPVLGIIEGYAYGARNWREHAGALTESIKLILWRAGIEFLVCPPTSLKAYVIGGKASKSQMLLHVYKTWGFEASSDDEADAYALAKLGFEAETPNSKAFKVVSKFNKILDKV